MKAISTIAASLLFTFLSFSSIAQINTSSQWTWIGGDNTPNNSGVYGTKGIASAENKPGGRGGASACWKDSDGNFWLFGGYDFTHTYMNDFWKYNINTNEWTWVSGSKTPSQLGTYGTLGIGTTENIPGARFQSSTWTDAYGNFWLFGGYGFASTFVGSFYRNLNDLWKYNSNNKQWTWVNGGNTNNAAGVYGTKGIPASTNQPGARYSSVSWIDGSGNLWLFGGISYSERGSELFNDLWKYNIASNQWTWVSGSNTVNQPGTYGIKGTGGSNTVPGARNEAVSWSDNDGNLWVFGGMAYTPNGFGYVNDLWKYNITSNVWTWINGASEINQLGNYGNLGVAASSNMPGGRSADSRSLKDANGDFLLFGSYGYASGDRNGYLNDLWKYNIASNEWTWINGANTTNHTRSFGIKGLAAAGNNPGARSASCIWTDVSNNFWLFGGAGSGGFNNDLWKLNNISVLPIIFTNIKAYQQYNNIAVEWKVENESGIKQYDVEKSTDGLRFVKAGIQAARDNNNGKVNYNWIDANPQTGNNYYRIASTTLNGERKFTQVVKVSISRGVQGFNVYPNPVVNGLAQLQFINQPKGLYNIRIINAAGQVVKSYQIAHEAGSSTEELKLNGATLKGNYTVEIVAPDKARKSIGLIYK